MISFSGMWCVCVSACLSVIISLYSWGYLCECWYGIGFYWGAGEGLWFFFFLFFVFLLISWMFQHHCLDTCCFWESYTFCVFVFAPVQRNWACFTWKGTLEIRSLLLVEVVCSLYHQHWTSPCLAHFTNSEKLHLKPYILALPFWALCIFYHPKDILGFSSYT